MSYRFREAKSISVGQNALHEAIGGQTPEPFVRSRITRTKHTFATSDHILQDFLPQYETDGSLKENLRFAFKYEPLNLGIVFATLEAMGGREIEDWVHLEPTGVYSRRAWFFYEFFSDKTLDLPTERSLAYVDALDEKRHYVAAPLKSPRHHVRNNLLGNSALCPTLRRTPELENAIASRLDLKIDALTSQYAPEVFARAVNYLYTKETRSSFAIEGEVQSPKSEERFVQALRHAGEFNRSDKAELVRLQSSFVDSRYAATDWRDFQNFVGETGRDFQERVHFICPKPEDIPQLMEGWAQLTRRLVGSPNLDPVLAAAVSAFAFVFLHPFEDGNGRIHRFLIHSILAQRRFTPPGLVFPVSAAILRQPALYDQTLERFSGAILPLIDWRFTDDSCVEVKNETRNLYRFFDATPQAEFLFARINETIDTDFPEELSFLTRFDAAYAALRDVVEMPNARARLLIKLCFQNRGRLSHNKRKLFDELSDDELSRIEERLQTILDSDAK